MAVERKDPQPTPTQAENDAAAAGEHVDVKEYDGSPLQNHESNVLLITALTPASAVAGDATDITMVVTGTGFTDKTVIVFNDYDEPTTLVSDTEVSTIVKPSVFPGVDPAVPCRVRNGAAYSNTLQFAFTAAGTRKAPEPEPEREPEPEPKHETRTSRPDPDEGAPYKTRTSRGR